ncbi:PQQ-binding-like beta-propeller repeat protein [Dactylosporangium sp. NPDC051485]|uniref:outer membrane protein assembly factor BamB family protein n=1 Tax=Dactylosporangium sp. NPDC051485 TaxID=3154846 RepID=UPI003423E80E
MRRAVRVLPVAVLLLAGCTEAAGPAVDDGPRAAAVWTAALPGEIGAPQRAVEAEGRVLVRAERGLAVLDGGSGAVRWQRPADKAAAVALTRAGVVLAEPGRPVRVLDAGTGAELRAFTDVRDRDRFTIGADAAYRLRPGPDPTLTAVDLATGAARWSRPLRGAQTVWYVRAAEPLQPGPIAVVPVAVQGVDGHRSIVSLTTAAGDQVATVPIADPAGVRLAAPDMLLAWDTQRTACDVTVTAYDLSAGASRWTATVGQWLLSRPDDAPQCAAPGYLAVAGDWLLTLDPAERPQVRDVHNGDPAWTGPAGDYPLGVAGGIVVTRTDHGRGPLAGYDLSGGERRWTTALDRHNRTPASALNEEHAVVGTTLVATVDRLDRASDAPSKVQMATAVTAFDTATGRQLWTSTGSVRLCGTTGDAAFACQGGNARPPELRRYRL